MYQSFVLVSLIFILIGCQGRNDDSAGVITRFPEVVGPIRITEEGKEHFFASYYGINSFSQNQRYATVLQTAIKHRLPTENDTALLGLVDLETLEFKAVAKTRAWNFQQGCMAHWLATNPDSLVIFNDFREGRFVAVVVNVFTLEEQEIYDRPVSAVSPDGKYAVSLNFTRLRAARDSYGYGGEGQQTDLAKAFPEDDGLFLINLATGEPNLLISYAQVKAMVPDLPEAGYEYFNHTLFSRNGSKIFWLARARPERNTTALTINTDGSGIRKCFPEGWGGSHYDWLNDDELMVTSEFEGQQYGHILFTVGQSDYRRLGNGLLDYDGHGTFSPDGKWMITDTYPKNGLREQKIFLMDMETEATLSLGRYAQPEAYRKKWRCDIHCRWSSGGDIVGFNSAHSGNRQAYIFQLVK